MTKRADRVYLPFSGLLPVDKPTGMTSHDVVHEIRRHFSIKKVGHGGTLDPAATGLLMILLGKGTKASDWVMRGDKGYAGTLTLGQSTSTQDAEGKILEERPTDGITAEQIEQAFVPYQGDIEQIPPMVSAIKKGGVPLYKMAREGKTIERDPRPVTIHTLEITRNESPDVDFQMTCTKGTYVRTLCHDIGEDLGCGGHLSALRRTASGIFTVDQAFQLDDILSWDPDTLAEKALPVPAEASAK